MVDISSSDLGNFTQTTSQILSSKSAEAAVQRENQKKQQTVQKAEQRVVAEDSKTTDRQVEKPSDKLDSSKVISEAVNKREAIKNLAKFNKTQSKEQTFFEVSLGLDKIKDPNFLAKQQKELNIDLGLDLNPDSKRNKFSPNAILKNRIKEEQSSSSPKVSDEDIKKPLIPAKSENEEFIEIKAIANEKQDQVIKDSERKAKEENDREASKVIRELNEVDLRELNEKEKESPAEKSIRQENLQAFKSRPALTEELLSLDDERLARTEEREAQFEKIKETIRELENSGSKEKIVEVRTKEESVIVEDKKETSAFNEADNEARKNQTVVSQSVQTQAEVANNKNKETLSNSFSKQVDPTQQFDKGTELQQIASDVSKKQDDAVDTAVKAAEERDKLTEVLITKEQIIKETDINSQEERSKILEQSSSAFATPTPDEVVAKRRVADFKEVEQEVKEVVQARKDFTNEQKSLTIEDKELFPTELTSHAQIGLIEKQEEVSKKERPLLDTQENKRNERENLEKIIINKKFIEDRFFEKKQRNNFDRFV